MIERIKAQPEPIQSVALKNLRNNSFALLPENVLYAMVMSDDIDVRESCPKNIKSIRKGKKANKRINKITNINYEAEHWSELIDLSQEGVCEPGVTVGFSDEEIEEAILTGSKLSLPVFPSHSQSVERAVKLTSEASCVVFGQEARHKHIVAKVLSRKSRPAFSSKGHYEQAYSDIF